MNVTAPAYTSFRSSLSKLIILLRSIKSNNTAEQQSRISKEVNLQASKVSEDVTTERHFMQLTPDGNYFVFDPRYLVFEFTYSLMLRKSQVVLVDKVRSAQRHRSASFKVINFLTFSLLVS